MQCKISKTISMVFKPGYRRLPNELINYIWEYDNRFKLQFKDCVYELIHYFHKHRFTDMLSGELSMYSIYKDAYPTGYSIINLPEYILRRKRLYRHDVLCLHNLKYCKLKSV